MKEEIAQCVYEVFEETVKSYETILNQYFPSLKKTRFTERNQTFFFAHNYLNSNADSIIWQELPIQFENRNEVENKTTKSAGHIDTLIIDKKKEAIIFIEAKCISEGKSRIGDRLEAIQQDLKRLDNIVTRKPNAGRCPQFPLVTEKYAKYILILADIWNSGEGSESSKVLDCWALNKPILWGKGNNKSFKISCTCEEIAVGKELICELNECGYNLLYRLYKA